jgi:hypothetical protein
MTDFQKNWENAKKQFETETGQKKPAPETKTIFGTVTRKSTDIAAALKSVDAAFAKKSRTDAVEAYKKFALAQGGYVEYARAARKGLDDDSKMQLDLLVSALNKISTKIGAEIEALREQKSGTAAKVPADTFLADFVADLKILEKEAKTHAVLEKKWAVLKHGEPLLRDLKEYSAFSAKSEYQKASVKLYDFRKKSEVFAAHCGFVVNQEKQNQAAEDSLKSVKTFSQFVTNLWPSRMKRQAEMLSDAAEALQG